MYSDASRSDCGHARGKPDAFEAPVLFKDRLSRYTEYKGFNTHANSQDVTTEDGCHRSAVPYLTANRTTPDMSTAPSAVPSGVDTEVDTVDNDLEHRTFWSHGGVNSHHHGAPCGIDGNLRFAMLVFTGTAAAWEERTRKEANARRATMTSNRTRGSRMSTGAEGTREGDAPNSRPYKWKLWGRTRTCEPGGRVLGE